MQVVTAADLKNRLGSLFDAIEHDPGESVVIERNKCTVAMRLNPQIAEQAILGAYAKACLPGLWRCGYSE